MTSDAPETPSLFATRLGTTGPPLVFLHGLFGQGRNFTTVAKALADRFRVTLPDLTNHGRSPWTADVSYPGMAASVADLVEDGGPAHVVGHSMGGKVAMTLALTRPDLVDRLVVADIAPVAYQRMSGFAGYVAAMRALDLPTLPDRTAADERLRPAVPDPAVRAFLLQNLRRDGGGWRWQVNLDLLGDRLEVLGGWPELHAAPSTAPVLWLAGGRSDYVRPAYAEPMRRLFPRTRLVTLRDAGHWLHSEEPEVFVAAVRRFLHP